jgi:hypothetical protein
VVEIRTPPNVRVIDEVWVGLSEDKDGKNGICAWFAPGVGGAPMVTGSPKMLELFKEQIDDLARITGLKVKVYRFTRAEVVAESKDG